mmetsp:Transcript_25275/g.61469  ORF Transcript_25275/g.61469 Transcript_25275/m.61469 type:complete len:360 (-) Transcript_25275:219-1298(-)
MRRRVRAWAATTARACSTRLATTSAKGHGCGRRWQPRGGRAVRSSTGHPSAIGCKRSSSGTAAAGRRWRLPTTLGITSPQPPQRSLRWRNRTCALPPPAPLEAEVPLLLLLLLKHQRARIVGGGGARPSATRRASSRAFRLRTPNTCSVASATARRKCAGVLLYSSAHSTSRRSCIAQSTLGMLRRFAATASWPKRRSIRRTRGSSTSSKAHGAHATSRSRSCWPSRCITGRRRTSRVASSGCCSWSTHSATTCARGCSRTLPASATPMAARRRGRSSTRQAIVRSYSSRPPASCRPWRSSRRSTARAPCARTATLRGLCAPPKVPKRRRRSTSSRRASSTTCSSTRSSSARIACRYDT